MRNQWVFVGFIAAVFLILFVTNVLQYFFGINVIASIKNVFTNEPEVDITVDETNPVITGDTEGEEGKDWKDIALSTGISGRGDTIEEAVESIPP